MNIGHAADAGGGIGWRHFTGAVEGASSAQCFEIDCVRLMSAGSFIVHGSLELLQRSGDSAELAPTLELTAAVLSTQ